ncbi:MAG: hypothetical protein PHS17_19665, partial [Desulfobacterales bacterium]|nr:hypothetical protein [Desulfobacterales bacterium]
MKKVKLGVERDFASEHLYMIDIEGCTAYYVEDGSDRYVEVLGEAKTASSTPILEKREVQAISYDDRGNILGRAQEIWFQFGLRQSFALTIDLEGIDQISSRVKLLCTGFLNVQMASPSVAETAPAFDITPSIDNSNYEEGREAYTRGEFAKCVHNMSRQIGLSGPGRNELFLYRGVAHYLKGELDSATKDLNEFLHHLDEPSNLDLATNRFSDIEILKQLTPAFVNNAKWHCFCGFYYQQSPHGLLDDDDDLDFRMFDKYHREAFTSFNKAIDLDPACSESYCARAQFYFREPLQQIPDYTSAITL